MRYAYFAAAMTLAAIAVGCGQDEAARRDRRIPVTKPREIVALPPESQAPAAATQGKDKSAPKPPVAKTMLAASRPAPAPKTQPTASRPNTLPASRPTTKKLAPETKPQVPVTSAPASLPAKSKPAPVPVAAPAAAPADNSAIAKAVKTAPPVEPNAAMTRRLTIHLEEEKPTLVDYIVSTTQEHVKTSTMLENLQAILDEEAEMFVLKMWRMLIFEVKKVETGLSVSSKH